MPAKNDTQRPHLHNPYQGLTREQVVSTMQELLLEEPRNFFRMGLLYLHVVDSQVLKGTKYTNARDFIRGTFPEVSRTALGLYGAVARAFPEAVGTRFGMTRLQLLLTYTKAARLELNSEDPGDTSIQVPDAAGEVKPQPFSDCTVEKLRKAVAHLRASAPHGPTPITQEDRALYDGYLQAVMSRFPKGSPVRVLLRPGEEETLIDFEGIPISEVDRLSWALRQLHPARQLPEMGPVTPGCEPRCMEGVRLETAAGMWKTHGVG